MLNETLANELRKYLASDSSENSLNSLSDFLNDTLEDLKKQKEEAEKKIQRARETDNLIKVVTDYLLNHPKLSEKAKKIIEDEETMKESFEKGIDNLVDIINIAVDLEAALSDTSFQNLFSNNSLPHSYGSTTTAFDPKYSFSGTITGNVADTLAKFASKF